MAPDQNRRPTQAEKVLSYIHRYGSITTLDAFRDLGITRLPARIYDLQRRGYHFHSDWVSSRNRFGDTVSFKRYRLRGGHADSRLTKQAPLGSLD